jgi:hypothetical protein
MIKSISRFFLFTFLPLTAHASWSLGIDSLLYIGLFIGLFIVCAYLLYHFWIFLFAIPVLLVYYLAKLFRIELSEDILIFAGGGSLFTFGIPIAFLPKEYLQLEWYYVLLICLSVSTLFWFLVAFLLQHYENKLNKKND